MYLTRIVYVVSALVLAAGCVIHEREHSDLEIGEVCVRDSDCKSGRCDDGVCETRRGDGGRNRDAGPGGDETADAGEVIEEPTPDAAVDDTPDAEVIDTPDAEVIDDMPDAGDDVDACGT